MISRRPTFQILDETEELLVLSKAPGVMVHPTRPSDERTMLHDIRELLAYEIAAGATPGIINRLDRETSGLVLIAKNSQASRRCGMAMQERKVRKSYLAIACGVPGEERFVVDEPILRLSETKDFAGEIWLKRGVHPEGQHARTEFRVLQQWEDERGGAMCLLRCHPITGRTHQIRVHLSWYGLPVLGDKLYGPSDKLYLEFIRTGWTDRLDAELQHPRHALHSSELSIDFDGQKYFWKCPLAEDLQGWLPGSLT
ncbi:MAG: RluA family pseudouridine synthase [Chthoniobacterales bacterium]